MPSPPHRPTPAQLARLALEHLLLLAALSCGLVIGAFLRAPDLPSPLDLARWMRPEIPGQLLAFTVKLGRFQPHLLDYLAWNVAAAAVLQYAMVLQGLYDRLGIRRARNEALRLLRASGVALLVITVIFFFARPPELGRTAIVIGYALGIGLVALARTLVRTMRPPRIERLVLLGSGAGTREAVRAIEAVGAPCDIAGIVGPREHGVEGVRWLGPWEDLGALLEREAPQRILIGDPPPQGFDPVPVMRARLDGIVVAAAREHAENLTGEVHEDDPGLEFLVDATARPYGRISRLADVVVSLALVAITAPVTALAALAILLADGRPVLFAQARVGLGGRRFRCLKLRTMRNDAESAGPAWSPEGDPRVTGMGRMLRRFRIDELPQLANILRGDMAFVGPRAEQPFFVEKLARALPYYDLRHVVRPGLTGWAQVRASYGSSLEDARRKLRFDLFYIKHRSAALDLAIVLDTVRVVLLGRGR